MGQSELRAFPRFSCSTPARIVAGEVEEEGQVIDMSQGGCKMLPYRLHLLKESRLEVGTTVALHLGGLLVEAKVVWATPNYSALGCQFVVPRSEPELRRVMELRHPER